MATKTSLLFIILLFSISPVFSQTDSVIYKQAKSLVYQGKFDQAVGILNKALKTDSLNYDYLSTKADALYGAAKYQDAFYLYTRLIDKYPTKSALYNGRGNLLLSAKEYEYAINDFTLATQYAEHDTIRIETINNRAAAKLRMRDFKSSYEDLMTAYKIDSNHLGTLTNLSVVSDEIGKGDETLKYLLKAVAIDSNYYPAYANIGFKYQLMGDYASSTKYYDKVLKYNPNEGLAYSNRSYNKLKMGDINGAKKDVEKAIQLSPGNSYAYRNKALIDIEEKNFKKACVDLNLAIDKGFTRSYGDEVEKLQKKYCEKN